MHFQVCSKVFIHHRFCFLVRALYYDCFKNINKPGKNHVRINTASYTDIITLFTKRVSGDFCQRNMYSRGIDSQWYNCLDLCTKFLKRQISSKKIYRLSWINFLAHSRHWWRLNRCIILLLLKSYLKLFPLGRHQFIFK